MCYDINMTTNDVRNMFPVGTTVNVRGNSQYFCDFTGTVVGHRPALAGWHGEFIVVQDEDGARFDCLPNEVFFCTDNIMHQ